MLRSFKHISSYFNRPKSWHWHRQEWVDVPMAFVGRVIGKKGEQIRKICDESGAVRGTEIPGFPMWFCYGMPWTNGQKWPKFTSNFFGNASFEGKF